MGYGGVSWPAWPAVPAAGGGVGPGMERKVAWTVRLVPWFVRTVAFGPGGTVGPEGERVGLRYERMTPRRLETTSGRCSAMLNVLVLGFNLAFALGLLVQFRWQ